MVEGAGGVSGREDLENPSRPPSPANGRSRFGSLAVTVGPHAGKVSVRLPELRLSNLLVLQPPAPTLHRPVERRRTAPRRRPIWISSPGLISVPGHGRRCRRYQRLSAAELDALAQVVNSARRSSARL